jgi:hypothetical protein
MVTLAGDEHASLFKEKFGLADGDYIEIQRWTSHNTSRWVKARIVEVEHCWFNSCRSYSAMVKVVPLNLGGELGCTRRIFISSKCEPEERWRKLKP